MHGHGTTLVGASTGAMTLITNVEIGGIEVDDLDMSSMSSTNKWREFEAGMKNAGEASFDMLYEKDQVDAVMSALGGANEAWTITFTDGSTFVCDGYLKGTALPVPFEDKVTQSASLKLSGEPVFTPAS